MTNQTFSFIERLPILQVLSAIQNWVFVRSTIYNGPGDTSITWSAIEDKVGQEYLKIASSSKH